MSHMLIREAPIGLAFSPQLLPCPARMCCYSSEKVKVLDFNSDEAWKQQNIT
jgi:hypothetical protein